VAPEADPLIGIAAAPPGPTVGAFFDLDGTLVAGFTPTAHAADRIRRGQARIGEVLGVVEASLRYKLGRMQFGPLLTRAARFLRGESLAELDAVSERLYADHTAARIYPVMRKVVEAHRERGHTLVLSSSALSIHVRPVARDLGIEHTVCNTFELDDRGLLTGRVNRPIVWGHQKATAVEDFCRHHGVDLARSYFYADGDEDAPLMALVGNPRPVNPRAGLAALAASHDWQVLRVTAPGQRGAASALDHLPGLARAAVARVWSRVVTWRGAGRR